jgi:DNA-binding beta-propeller fold protein YncE
VNYLILWRQVRKTDHVPAALASRWDDLLMNGDDPEQRIADLERRLAEPKSGAERPPVGTLDEETSRRFLAIAAPPTTKQMMKFTGTFFTVAIASLGVLYMALFLVGAIVGSTAVMQIGGTVVFFGFFLSAMPVYAALNRRMNRDKTVLVCAGGDGVTVNTRPGDVFPFGDSQLGRWTLEGYGTTTKGTALHLVCDRERFVLGGRDHRVAAGVPMAAPPVDTVDAWMWAPEFDELLTMVGRSRGLDVRGPAPGQPIRCLLVPNAAKMFSSSFFGMFKNTATALQLNSNPPQASIAIDVGEDTISVTDLKSNTQIASAPIAQVTATPAQSTRSMLRVGTMTAPVLVVGVPNSQPLTIGCPDLSGPPQVSWKGSTKLTYRFSWRGEVPAENEPAFVVSDPDWLTLVEKLGLAPRLEDRARGDAGAAAVPGRAPMAQPPHRRRRIYVLLLAAVLFIAASVMMFVASSISSSHELKDQLVQADRLRQFALPFTDLRAPHGVAVDGAGTVYVTDTHTNRVLKLARGSDTQTVLPFTGLDLCPNLIDASTAAVAVDTVGNVYVTDSCHDRVVKLAVGSNTQTVLPFEGLDTPHGVAVDGAGTVYVVDFSHGGVFKLAAGTSEATRLPPTGGGGPSGAVAVDTTGNVYISCDRGRSRNSCLMKLAPGSNTWTRLPSAADNSGDTFSTGEQDVAVDSAGTVYMITSRVVMKLAPGANNWAALPGASTFLDPMGLAVDPAGKSVYVTDHVGSRATGEELPWMKDDAAGFVLKLPTG